MPHLISQTNNLPAGLPEDPAKIFSPVLSEQDREDRGLDSSYGRYSPLKHDSKLAELLAYLYDGGKFKPILSKLDIGWGVVSAAKSYREDFRMALEAALASRDFILQNLRQEEAERRAMEGSATTVYDADGVVQRVIVKPSDRLLERLLESGDPTRFKNNTPQSVTNVLQIGNSNVIQSLSEILEENAQTTLVPPGLDKEEPPEPIDVAVEDHD